MGELIRWMYDFLTGTTDQKLDVIIRGIEILRAYAEKNITNEEQRLKWETEVKSWVERIWDARVAADSKVMDWLNKTGGSSREYPAQGASVETADTSALTDEVRLIKESLRAEIAETRDQVIYAREAVAGLDARIAALAVAFNDLSARQAGRPAAGDFLAHDLDRHGQRA